MRLTLKAERDAPASWFHHDRADRLSGFLLDPLAVVAFTSGARERLVWKFAKTEEVQREKRSSPPSARDRRDATRSEGHRAEDAPEEAEVQKADRGGRDLAAARATAAERRPDHPENQRNQPGWRDREECLSLGGSA